MNYPDMKMPVHTYGDVTFEDFTVDATEDSYAQIALIDNGSLNMIGNSSTGISRKDWSVCIVLAVVVTLTVRLLCGHWKDYR
ncbi:MAG: hypothetical protein ACLT4C_04610 [Butyricicoccus sp.]